MRCAQFSIAVLVAFTASINISVAKSDSPSSELLYEMVEAKPLERKAARYPEESARRGQEGWVQVSYVIDNNGQVIDPVIIDSSGVKDFEKATLRAIKKWQYSPAMRDGEPIQQCQMKVQMDFVLNNGSDGVRKRFRAMYMKASDYLEQGNFVEADDVLSKMKSRKIWNMYENAWFWMLDAKVASALKDESRELSSLSRAVSSNDGDKYLGSDNFLLSQQRIFILQLKSELYTDALDTFQIIEDSPNSQKISANLLETAKKLENYMNSDQLLVRNQKIGSRGVEVHKLYRNSFGVSELNGNLETVDIRCQSKRTKFTFKEDSMWSVPASWGECSVLFEGDEGTSFKIVEVNPEQIDDNQS
ncbi:energy transducer TonB [Aliiglaciecola sp. M165]|uniref:energy transducer TonB n=1 Tax=Aliiglaciecola sp. M165 TaxID=2593649 RepID=UPI00163DC5B4|nr:energy transducer TonB [Aliiglaciecola sp. M165]